MIKKFTVAWLLGLFVWNVALAGVPSLLLCLHADSLVHLQLAESGDSHCEETHEHAASGEPGICVMEDDCTDLQLLGSEQIPSRLNEVETPDLPAFSINAFSYPFTQPHNFQQGAQLQPPSRGPPSIHWLTDILIKKTVLRV